MAQEPLGLFRRLTSENWQTICLLVLLSVSAFLLYLPSEIGTSLTIPPDSSEYAISLDNLFRHGSFGFTLNGIWYPSRYAPWFSLSCLSPAYLLSGCNALCLHWSILVFALGLQAILFFVGKKIGLGWFSFLPPVLILFLPDFVFYSRIVMTEIPYVTLLAVSGLLFLRFYGERLPSKRFCFCVGVVVAWCGMVRSTGLPMLAPFAVLLMVRRVSWKSCLIRVAWLVLPSVLYEFANFSYNWHVFGDPLRSGYNYWLPVPYDFPDLMFSLGNLREALPSLASLPVVWVTILFLFVSLMYAALLLKRDQIQQLDNRTFVLFLGYILFQGLVLVILYLGYYWTDTRFFLPLTLCAIPLFLKAVMSVFSYFGKRVGKIACSLLGILVFAVFLEMPNRYQLLTFGRPIWLVQAQIAGHVLPTGSVLIQNGDPNVVEHFGLKGTGITMIPFRRLFDYASHMIAPVSIRDRCAKRPGTFQQIVPELIVDGTCILPFPKTFVEDPSYLKEVLDQEKRVFIEQSLFSSSDQWEAFQKQIWDLGLTSKLFGVWEAPGIRPNPVRSIYDEFIFPECAMDSRPEVTVVYHEICAAK